MIIMSKKKRKIKRKGLEKYRYEEVICTGFTKKKRLIYGELWTSISPLFVGTEFIDHVWIKRQLPLRRLISFKGVVYVYKGIDYTYKKKYKYSVAINRDLEIGRSI